MKEYADYCILFQLVASSEKRSKTRCEKGKAVLVIPLARRTIL